MQILRKATHLAVGPSDPPPKKRTKDVSPTVDGSELLRHHLKCIKPCNGIFSIITWIAGFLNHQQYFITLCYFIGLSIIRQVHNIEKLHHHQKNSTTLFCSFAWDDNSLESGGSNIILRSPKEPPNPSSGKSNEWLQKPVQSCSR